MNPSAGALFEAIDATWPAARTYQHGPWTVRAGDGGGKRVSAATANGAVNESDVRAAEAAMESLGQNPLFMVRNDETILDATLQRAGYEIIDPVSVLACPIDTLTSKPIPPVTTFKIWEPLAIMNEIWAQGGVGPARLDVMRRAKVKTAILARWNQKPAGTGFVAIHDLVAMVHAVEVLPDQRRQGVATWIMRQSAFYGLAQGAKTVAVLCTKANDSALKLYSGLGFEQSAEYHYRKKLSAGDDNYG